MITLGFSPCPNDTFIFDALVHHKINTEGLQFQFWMEDVETLNRLALTRVPDMIKVSYHAFLKISDDYEILKSGSAMGFGSGPLLISRKDHSAADLQNLVVAVPGEHTTAHLLLNFAAPKVKQKIFMVFHEIEEAVLTGRANAGVIIHENRFTYEQKGLKKILDLGVYWEKQTASPIPLGGIAVRRSLGNEMITRLGKLMKMSVLFARKYPEEVMGFVRSHAQEMDEEVMKKHISLYVNDFTVDMGPVGELAIATLLKHFKGTV
jgi:1,4-dihydroxy-6-naphthoate synthase